MEVRGSLPGNFESANDALVIKSLEGDLQSEARVVYRQAVGEKIYAVGVQLIAPEGNWQTRF